MTSIMNKLSQRENFDSTTKMIVLGLRKAIKDSKWAIDKLVQPLAENHKDNPDGFNEAFAKIQDTKIEMWVEFPIPANEDIFNSLNAEEIEFASENDIFSFGK